MIYWLAVCSTRPDCISIQNGMRCTVDGLWFTMFFKTRSACFRLYSDLYTKPISLFGGYLLVYVIPHAAALGYYLFTPLGFGGTNSGLIMCQTTRFSRLAVNLELEA